MPVTLENPIKPSSIWLPLCTLVKYENEPADNYQQIEGNNSEKKHTGPINQNTVEPLRMKATHDGGLTKVVASYEG